MAFQSPFHEVSMSFIKHHLAQHSPSLCPVLFFRALTHGTSIDPGQIGQRSWGQAPTVSVHLCPWLPAEKCGCWWTGTNSEKRHTGGGGGVKLLPGKNSVGKILSQILGLYFSGLFKDWELLPANLGFLDFFLQ